MAAKLKIEKRGDEIIINPITTRHNIAEILLKLVLNTNQSFQ
jgi:virulence-associated protein VagC